MTPKLETEPAPPVAFPEEHRSHRSDILFGATVLLVIYLAFQVINVLLLVYISALFAVVLAPAIGLVRRVRIGSWRPGRGLAMLVLLLALLTFVVLFSAFAIPPIYSDGVALAENWPTRVTAMVTKLHKVPFFEDFNPSKLETVVSAAIPDAFGIFRNVAGGVMGLFYWFIITAYFILDGERAFYWALSMFPSAHRQRLERTLIRAEVRMRHWLVGQLALMVLLGTSSGIFFTLIGMKYAAALAVFSGMVNIVPILGPALAITLASIVALFDSPTKLVAVLFFFFIYQQTETGFLGPRIMKSTVDLPPLAVVIALTLGGALAGVLGALVAVPTAALCAVLIDEYLVKKDSKFPGEAEAGG
jgi:predicted PurR-regulated permease PerM